VAKKHKRINRDTDVHDDETVRQRRQGELMLMDRREIVGRILDTAILLWFAERDPVSIHLLACVAHQNLDAIGKRKGSGGPALKDNVTWEDIYSAYNDIRHSNGDPNHRDQFVPGNNLTLLTDCVGSFKELFGFHSPWMMTFGCFLTGRIFPQPDDNGGAKRQLRSLFPSLRIDEIAKLPMQQFAQKMQPIFQRAFTAGFQAW
jgi:hypothetical protein